MLPPLPASLIRTIVPLVVGWLIALPVTPWLLTVAGVGSDQAAAWLGGIVTTILASAWYLLGRLLEVYVRPRLGWLLGLAQQPTYPPSTPRHAKG